MTDQTTDQNLPACATLPQLTRARILADIDLLEAAWGSVYAAAKGLDLLPHRGAIYAFRSGRRGIPPNWAEALYGAGAGELIAKGPDGAPILRPAPDAAGDDAEGDAEEYMEAESAVIAQIGERTQGNAGFLALLHGQIELESWWQTEIEKVIATTEQELRELAQEAADARQKLAALRQITSVYEASRDAPAEAMEGAAI